jgi:hypothetical protein
MTDYFMAHGMTDAAGARHQRHPRPPARPVKQQALIMGFSDTFSGGRHRVGVGRHCPSPDGQADERGSRRTGSLCVGD